MCFHQQSGMKSVFKLLLLLLLCCQFAAAEDDPHSFSEPEKARATHLDLDLKVDFENRRLVGTATWDFERSSGDEIIFAEKHLQVTSLSDLARKLAASNALGGGPNMRSSERSPRFLERVGA